MENKQVELDVLVEFIREQFQASGINLDYSFESLKHLDALMESEYKNGKLLHPESSFAEKEGLILTGIAGYVAKTLTQNGTNSEIIIDQEDENWYISFKVKSANGWEFEPGQRVLKRKIEGSESDLYHYAVVAKKYMISEDEGGEETAVTNELHGYKKKWWKFW